MPQDMLAPTAALLAGALVASIAWYVVYRRARSRIGALGRQLHAARVAEDELHTIQSSVQSLGHRHLPPGQRPDRPSDTLRALDRACASWSKELKHLHKRLVGTLHSLHRAREGQKQLRERVAQLDQMLLQTPEYDIRAQFTVIAKERDVLRERVQQLNQLLSVSENTTEDADNMVALTRQNESLRGELRSARRLIRSLERHISVLEREDATKKGFSVDRLLKTDLPAGAFESLSDVPLDDPEVRVTDSIN